ncbi:MAG: hypothetical protein EOP22_18020 [Hyphomicrobiales bacterium]|nr:MAG: hypothetical protein EOP22_18020 [Hyphomicrobiales bacterium]
MPSNAHAAFAAQLGSVDQLITIHEKMQRGRGRRHEQDALHRAGVVLIVAAWQSYVERVLGEALDIIGDNVTAAGAPLWGRQMYVLRRKQIDASIKKFNTPKDDNVRDLFLESLGFNPWPHWGWVAGTRNWTSETTRTRTNDWVNVRHAIAHGFEFPNKDFLRGRYNLAPHLTLQLLKDCKKHFIYLVDKTDAAFGAHLVAELGFAPWP